MKSRHETQHTRPTTQRQKSPGPPAAPLAKPPSYSLHLSKLREIQNQVLAQKVSEANEVRKFTRDHKSKYRRQQQQ